MNASAADLHTSVGQRIAPEKTNLCAPESQSVAVPAIGPSAGTAGDEGVRTSIEKELVGPPPDDAISADPGKNLPDIALASYGVGTEPATGTAGDEGAHTSIEKELVEPPPNEDYSADPDENIPDIALASYREEERITPFTGSAVPTACATSEGKEVVERRRDTEPVSSTPAAQDGEEVEDISVASFGKPGAGEYIIGRDDRMRIHNTENYPWRVHAQLAIEARDGTKWFGTGWFVGADTLVTVGHTVYVHGNDPARTGWVKSITVMPGRNGNHLPFGSAEATHLYSVKGWTEKKLRDYNYGAIKIGTDLGNRTGYFGCKVYSDCELVGSVLNVSGYPATKQPFGTMWYMWARVIRTTERRLYYDADTTGGQAGSALYKIESNGKRFVFAVHSQGSIPENSGTRVTSQVYSNITAWRNA